MVVLIPEWPIISCTTLGCYPLVSMSVAVLIRLHDQQVGLRQRRVRSRHCRSPAERKQQDEPGGADGCPGHRASHCLPPCRDFVAIEQCLGRCYKTQRSTPFNVSLPLSSRPTTEDRSSVDTLAFDLENDRLNRRGEYVPGERDLFFASERWRELIVADLNVSIPVPARPP